MVHKSEVKKNFSFPDSPLPIATDKRIANSLEFIAHYLDRIDNNLKLISNSLQSGGVNEPLRAQLMNIETALKNLKTR